MSKPPRSWSQSYNNPSTNKLIVRLVCYHLVLSLKFEFMQFQKGTLTRDATNTAPEYEWCTRSLSLFLVCITLMVGFDPHSKTDLGLKKRVQYFSLKSVSPISKFRFHGAKTEQINYFSGLYENIHEEHFILAEPSAFFQGLFLISANPQNNKMRKPALRNLTDLPKITQRAKG